VVNGFFNQLNTGMISDLMTKYGLSQFATYNVPRI
jgi:hypothetical protein